jgi:DNA-binding MarR family transcriptional regulator/GNAT superfamily N-acetyltransferase
VVTDADLVRRFNRYYTEKVGALGDSYLGRRRPLAEARLLFEIGASGRRVRELRSRLGLDSGYLARLMRSLEQQRLVVVNPDTNDRRSRIAKLTRAGLRELAILNQRSDKFVADLLEPLVDEERHQVLEAMNMIYRVLRRAGVTLHYVDPGAVEAQRCLHAYASELARRFPEGYEVAHLVATDEIRAHGTCLVAREGDRPVACGVLKEHEQSTDEIKHLWVDPDMRGLGLSRILLLELEEEALRRGKLAVRLDTHLALTEAISLYRTSGYVEIPPYGSNPHAGVWFEKRLDISMPGCRSRA